MGEKVLVGAGGQVRQPVCSSQVQIGKEREVFASQKVPSFVRRMFSDFMSLCSTRFLWQYARPLATCLNRNLAYVSSSFFLRRMKLNRSPPAHNSITKHKCDFVSNESYSLTTFL